MKLKLLTAEYDALHRKPIGRNQISGGLLCKIRAFQGTNQNSRFILVRK